MKSLIKLMTAFALITFVTTATFAQRPDGPPSPEKVAERQTKHMTKALELDEAQTAQVKDLNFKFAEKMQAAREEAGDDRAAMRENRKALQEERKAAMKEVLTEAQFVEFEKLEAEHMGRRKKGKGKKKDAEKL